MLNNIACYEVKRLIHETKETAIYEGECLITNEKVAIKVIKKDAVLNLSYSIKNVTSEIQILKITKHKNVDSLYQIIEDNNNIYLIKEYVNGSNLYDTLNTTCVPFSEDVSAKILLDIIDVLTYLKELSIYHGGITGGTECASYTEGAYRLQRYQTGEYYDRKKR
jgi:serine/threonine protein kinase